jgi:dCTP deaminase
MSILSDKLIRARSLVPTHKAFSNQTTRRYYYTETPLGFYELAGGAFMGSREAMMASINPPQPMTETEVQGYCVGNPRMITPFSPELIRERLTEIDPPAGVVLRNFKKEKIVSYGTSSYGYDVRCADEFKIFTNINSTVVDPKAFDEKNFVNFKGDVCIIPPNSFALARTIERFKIPRDILTVCVGKSTYARCGIIVNVTPFEPEWEGYVTLEFSNTTPLPAKIYANEGVAQVLFFKADQECETSYADRGGKYQGQGAEVVCPKV